ncbi:hypothetical protein, partial [Burkholderia pseudomallei]|uniref:hypothetical protein n=1 Tax=Burkholderia pseudomallei TaxID=28450 RepID=UPI0009819430
IELEWLNQQFFQFSWHIETLTLGVRDEIGNVDARSSSFFEFGAGFLGIKIDSSVYYALSLLRYSPSRLKMKEN